MASSPHETTKPEDENFRVSLDDYCEIIANGVEGDNDNGERDRHGDGELPIATGLGVVLESNKNGIPDIILTTPDPSPGSALGPAPEFGLGSGPGSAQYVDGRDTREPPLTQEDTDWSDVPDCNRCLRADDAYSQAETNVREKKIQPAWARPRHEGGRDGDDDDGIPGRGGLPVNDELYDSDLESQAGNPSNVKREHHKKMQRWRAMASNRYERMLLECIVNIDKIPPEYQNIHIDRAIIDRLEQVTSLSLSRTKAFDCGVLKDNKITGAILYGPPGTGKTLLAKSLARTSNYQMLSISTSELWQKCHGEDEKVIKAVFSLSRKMHPCIVFLDEADAMLGTRKAGEMRHIRSMLNQFLQEWDGLGSGGKQAPFLLLATNRPFDLDPAVLRRAPIQIELGVPKPAQRQGILKLLLDGETLGDGVDCMQLAAHTHGYTGSDLKNMCVQAATLAVAEQQTDTDQRVLTRRHFHEALKMVRPVALSTTMRNEFARFGGQNASSHGTAEE